MKSLPQLQINTTKLSIQFSPIFSRRVKEHYILDTNSSILVKQIADSIKAEFKINITYKQSHKLIFAVFPGTTSRVEHPVKIEAQGGFYSYKGIAQRPKRGRVQEVDFMTAKHSSVVSLDLMTRAIYTSENKPRLK